MEVKAVSFTGKIPKINPNSKNEYHKALAEAFEQSDKDYFRLTKKTNTKPKTDFTEEFIKNAKKFFSGVFGQ